MTSRALLSITIVLAAAGGCANDPQYIAAPMTLEAGVDMGGGMLSEMKASLMLPIKPESPADMTARAALATSLGMTMDQVPYVRVGDLDIEVAWTIKNLDTVPGQVKIELNGANEYHQFDPSVIMLSAPGDDDPLTTPGLAGDIPIDVPASGQVDGVFREDELLEASVDLDEITRGNLNPFEAVLSINKSDPSFDQLMPLVPPKKPGEMLTQAAGTLGPPIPRAAFAGMIQVDLVFKPDHHMTLEYDIRVRDHRGIVAEKGLDAVGQTCSGEGRGDSWPCTFMFTPTVYMP